MSQFPMQDKRKKIVSTYKKALTVEMNEDVFLKGTTLKQDYFGFLLCNGGLGDYINFMSTMVWAAKTSPHCLGRIYCSEPFIDVARYIMKPFKNWEVRHHSELKDLPEPHINLYYPEKDKQLVSAIGSHLMDLGSEYYANLDTLPDDHRYLPEIEYDGPWKWAELKGLNYAVLTPYATAPSRVLRPQYLRELTAYVKAKGLTPVFLGNKSHAADIAKQNNQVVPDEPYDFSQGIDLTGKTTLLEAIQIMGRAIFVAGLDNGLLHFAGTTQVPIIFGHSVTQVRHRDIRRKLGVTINIFVNESDLACSGCQSKMRYVKGHRFSECFYKSKPAVAYKCLDLLFANGCEAWKRAIDHILGLPRIASRMNNFDTNVIDS